MLAANYVGGPLHLGATYVAAPTTRVRSPANDKATEFGPARPVRNGPVHGRCHYVNNKFEDGLGNNLKRNAYRLSGMYTMGASEFHVNFGAAGRR